MNSQKKTDSKHASIHDIVNENKKLLRNQEINQLFSTPILSELDLAEFHHHSYMITNDMFTFFVHQLQKWNRKVRNRQVRTFYHAELNRNMFLYSSLKIICLKKPNEIKRYLEQLTVWYNKNSYNVPQPSVLMKKYNPNQEWEIRKTFKSNTPSEISNYRRRFLCSPDQKDTPFAQNILQIQKKKENCFFQTKNYPTKTYMNSKTMCDDIFSDGKNEDEPFKEIMKNKENKLAKLQNNSLRKKRQDSQINQAQQYWKNSHSRFGQKTCQNFFKGRFSKNKEFLQVTSRIEPRKIQTAAYNNRRSQQEQLVSKIKKGRIRTSLGIRKNFVHEQKQYDQKMGQKSINLKTEVNEQTKDEQIKWIDNFIVDEDKIDIRNTINTTGSGMLLISNPFDIGKGKIKKKRR